MNQLKIAPAGPLNGTVEVPGDKSISHRAVLLGALADGPSRVSNFLPGGDCLATLACMQALGVQIDRHDQTTLTIHGRGMHGLQAPAAPLNCSRSGTTMRLLTGMLTGQNFASTLTGDPNCCTGRCAASWTPCVAWGPRLGIKMDTRR